MLIYFFPLQRHDYEDYILFDVPPPLKVGRKYDENELIPISSFEDWVKVRMIFRFKA